MSQITLAHVLEQHGSLVFERNKLFCEVRIRRTSIFKKKRHEKVHRGNFQFNQLFFLSIFFILASFQFFFCVYSFTNFTHNTFSDIYTKVRNDEKKTRLDLRAESISIAGVCIFASNHDLCIFLI